MHPDPRGDGGPVASGDGDAERVALVAVDGGASRCRLAAFGASGRRLGDCAVDAHASLTLGEEAAWRTVRVGLARLLDGRWPPRLALGLAGALQEERRARFLERVASATGGASECRLVTDGHAQLVGASGGAPGVCLALGTGSVVHWLDRDGASGMAGGWGFPIGDEGSGAWLGARLLQRYLWHRDGERSGSPLMGVVEEHVGESVSALQRRTTDASSGEHARLARHVVEWAKRGDALAVLLLDEGAERCLRLLECAPAGLPVYVVGGLASAYTSRLAERLGREPDEPRGDALDGLRTIALEEATR